MRITIESLVTAAAACAEGKKHNIPLGLTLRFKDLVNLLDDGPPVPELALRAGDLRKIGWASGAELQGKFKVDLPCMTRCRTARIMN